MLFHNNFVKSFFIKSNWNIARIIMSDLKKTIKINPELFNMKSDKTRKNSGEKKQKVYQPLVINESSLKKQFLNRIKEHKNKEQRSNTRESLEDSFNNEFMDSIDYLSSLSQKHKANGDKARQQQQQQQQPQPQIRHNYTMKNQSQPQIRPSIPHVELDLPDELREPFVFTPSPSTQPVHLNPSSVPYGCLKNGTKPTYRAWQQQMTRRNMDAYQPQPTQQPQPQPTQVQIPQQIQTQQPPSNPIDRLSVYKEMSEREKKLELLKERMKQQQEMLIQERMKREHLEQQLKNREILEAQMKERQFASPKETEFKVNDSVLLSGGSQQKQQKQPKQFIKKTIRRKYTLGKSTIYKKVGILIKDKNTRKKVIQAQKDMKKKPLNEVKQYLKEHGLLKVGSNAPNDVIRKTFESAMLTGDVVNLNKDVLIHNLLNDLDSDS